MKNFSLYTEELDFSDQEGKNITVGKYETEYFTLCPGAVDAFNNLMKEPGVDMAKVEQAAKHVDQALAVEAKAIERGHSTQKDLEEYDEHATAAEEVLDELGDLENHEYYLRDVHEPKLVDMLDVDEISEDELEEDDEDEDYSHLDEDLEVEPFWDDDEDFENIFDKE
jgi:hypothetical protein